MNKTECLNILDDMLMDAWEYRDQIMKVAMNESWEVIHDAPKGLIIMAVNMSIRRCDEFTSELNSMIKLIEQDVYTVTYEYIIARYAEALNKDVERYNAVLEQIRDYTIKLTHKARFRKSYVRS